MNNIFASPGHISSRAHTYDGVQITSLGNHVMHFFFIYNLACTKNFNLFLPIHTHLENLFDIAHLIRPLPSDAVCVFKEEYGGSIDEYYLKDLKNVHKSNRLLKELNLPLPKNFWVEGWYYANSLMPTQENINKLKFQKSILKEYEANFKFLEQEDHISLHYRGSDFKNHQIGWGDMRLPFKYYRDCLNTAKAKGIKVVNIFSDKKDEIVENLKEFKNDFDFNFTSNTAYMDWFCLFKSKNLIASNSSFCWSAGLYNKDIVFQPKKFLLYNVDRNVLFPTDVYYNKSIVI
jgi:hypothetical protein